MPKCTAGKHDWDVKKSLSASSLKHRVTSFNTLKRTTSIYILFCIPKAVYPARDLPFLPSLKQQKGAPVPCACRGDIEKDHLDLFTSWQNLNFILIL